MNMVWFFSFSGILIENAMNRLLDQALDSSRYPTLPQFERDGLLWSLRQLSKAGITSCCESPCDWRRGQHRVWERVEQEGRLTCRWEKNVQQNLHLLKMCSQNSSV